MYFYKFIYSLFFLCLCCCNLVAQTIFQEGIITYKADTLYRNETNAPYIISEIRLYKKNNLYRLESVKTYLNTNIYPETEIQIINSEGKYLFMDLNNSILPLALLTSFEEGRTKKSEIAFRGSTETYFIDKVVGDTTFIDFPVEKLILKKETNMESIEILLSKDIETEFGFFFGRYRKIKGTPLQFEDDEGASVSRYMAISVENKKLPDNLFIVDAKYQVITVEELLETVKGN